MSSSPTSHEQRHDGLATDRLVLTTWTAGELSAVVEGRRLAHWAADFPAEGDRVVAGLVADESAWRTAYGHRQVALRDGAVVIGSIGLSWPPESGSLEIGFGIVPSARGSGYATEAVRAITAHALRTAGVHTVHAQVELANPAGVQVLRKAGYRRTSLAGRRRTARYERSTGLLR